MTGPAANVQFQDMANRRQAWAFGWATAADLAVLERDAKRTMRQANASPPLLSIKEAERITVIDEGGRAYVDLHGNNCHHIGYRHPKLLAALTDQLALLPFNVRGFTNDVFVGAAERLSSLWPGGDGRVFLVPGGAAAIELALAIARTHTGRYKSISFYGSYHGRSLGALSVSGTPHNRPPRLGPLLPGAMHVPGYRVTDPPADPDGEAAARASLAAMATMFEQEGDIACVLGETIANGAHIPPQWYWSEVRALCDRYGALLILDEIPLGLGKTGVLFNSEHFDVVPDMTAIGKALGGTAVPAAAVVAGGHLDTAPEMNLGYFTHEKNPLLARAALATLEVIVDDGLLSHTVELGASALEQLKALQATYPRLIETVRGAGLFLSMDVGDLSDGAEHRQNLALEMSCRCIEQGLILNYAGRGATLSLSFPLISTADDVEAAFAKLDKVLADIPSGV